MSITDGFFFHDLGPILYNKESKSPRGLSVEYIWKLVSQLPPIPDVPPPLPKKAFSSLLSLRNLEKARERISFFTNKEKSTIEVDKTQ